MNFWYDKANYPEYGVILMVCILLEDTSDE